MTVWIDKDTCMYPRTVCIISIHFIYPVSWVVGWVSCNTWPNKGYAVKMKQWQSHTHTYNNNKTLLYTKHNGHNNISTYKTRTNQGGAEGEEEEKIEKVTIILHYCNK